MEFLTPLASSFKPEIALDISLVSERDRACIMEIDEVIQNRQFNKLVACLYSYIKEGLAHCNPELLLLFLQVLMPESMNKLGVRNVVVIMHVGS